MLVRMLLACLLACVHASGGRAPLFSLGLGIADVAQVPHSGLLLSQIYPKSIPKLYPEAIPNLSAPKDPWLARGMLVTCSWQAPGMILTCFLHVLASSWRAPGMILACSWQAPGVLLTCF